ncbi:hypothetical protein CL659_01670 [bacterium]|nr:hypothetical protein [bacterium]|tara:strand:+ start:1124 stop:3106 length:1983 start_codon:yes stop_codon:yes gene_type:complete
MRLPICWLKEFIQCSYSTQEIADIFTEIGFECEEILEVEGEKVLDLSTPSNRTDVLSIYGLAREFATAKNLEIKKLELKDFPIDNKYPIKIESKNCQSYLGVHLKIKPEANAHIEKMLKLMGRNPINPLVDLTNYVLFETGQPLHLFPFNVMNDGVKISLANKKIKFNALDDKSYEIEAGDLLVQNKSNEPLALAGIIGSKKGSSDVSDSEFLLEAACFKNSSTRQSANRLNLSTDSSYRFQRIVDPKGFLLGAKRYLWWLDNLGWTNQVYSASSVEETLENHSISIKASEINKRLGMNIPEERVVQILESLGIRQISKDREGNWNDSWKIKRKKGLRKGEWLIPSHRTDLSIPEDLIEEVIRVYGYTGLKETLPKIQIKTSKMDDIFQLEEFLIDTLLSFGGRQEIRSSLVSEGLTLFGKSVLENKPVKLLNPRSKEKAFLRNSISACLLKGHEDSRKKDFQSTWSFEVGKVFKENEESLHLGLLIPEEDGGSRLIKTILESIAQKWNSEVFYFDVKNNYFLDSSALKIEAKVFQGLLGAIEIEIGSKKELVWSCELELKILWPMPKQKAKELPSHKFSHRDLTVNTKSSDEVKKVTSVIAKIKLDLIHEIYLFDVYKKKENWNLTWRLVIGDGKKSYKDSEINQAFELFKKELKKNGI